MANGKPYYNIDGTFLPIFKSFPPELANADETTLNQFGWFEVIPNDKIIPIGSKILNRTYNIIGNKAYENIEYEENNGS